MNARKGTTLVEVLVAIFVMGIGLLAVMTMFPLAAISMARSIRDDRVAHAAANAKAIAIAQSIRFDAKVTPFFNNPGTAVGLPTATNPFVNAGGLNPSWPVFVDPVGYSTYVAPGQNYVAGNSQGGIPRITPNFLNGAAALSILKWCTLQDDIAFGTNGQPVPLVPGNPNTFTRNPSPSISYAWLLRRPKQGVQTVVDMTVVVYNQRSFAFGAIATSAREAVYTVVLNVPNIAAPTPTTSVTIIWQPSAGIPQPQIVDGGWVLDMTPNPVANSNPPTFLPGNAKFYRVVSVGDIVVGQTIPGLGAGLYNMMPLELASPVQFTPAPPIQVPALPAAAQNQVMVFALLDGIVEVIEGGDSWRSWSN
jgi:prepilin-type N-terminal cleavage/methylation domain-containing protein